MEHSVTSTNAAEVSQSPENEQKPDSEAILDEGRVSFGSTPPPPPIQRTTQKLQSVNSERARRTEFQRLQRLYGNQYAGQVARSLNQAQAAPPPTPVLVARATLPPHIQRVGPKKNQPLKPNTFVQYRMTAANKNLSDALNVFNHLKLQFNLTFDPTTLDPIKDNAYSQAFNEVLYPYVFGRMSSMLIKAVHKEGESDAKKIESPTLTKIINTEFMQRRTDYLNQYQSGPQSASQAYQQTALLSAMDNSKITLSNPTIAPKAVKKISQKVWEGIGEAKVRKFLQKNEKRILKRIKGTKKDLKLAIDKAVPKAIQAELAPVEQEMKKAEAGIAQIEKSLQAKKLSTKAKAAMNQLSSQVTADFMAAKTKAKVLEQDLVAAAQRIEESVLKQAILEANQRQDLALNEAFTFFDEPTWLDLAKNPEETAFKTIAAAYGFAPKLEDNQMFQETAKQIADKTTTTAKSGTKAASYIGEAVELIERGALESKLKKLGNMIDHKARLDGAKYLFDMKLEVPLGVGIGAFIGFHIRATVQKDLFRRDEKKPENAFRKADDQHDKWRTIFDAQIGITGGGEFGATGTNMGNIKMIGELGGYVRIVTERGGQGIADLLSLSLYHRFSRSKIVPNSLVYKIWKFKGKSASPLASKGQAKKREADLWFKAMLEQLKDLDEAETGGYGAVKAQTKLSSELGMKGMIQGRYGTKISKAIRSEQELKHAKKYEAQTGGIDHAKTELKKLDAITKSPLFNNMSDEEKQKLESYRKKVLAKQETTEKKVSKGVGKNIGQGAGSLMLEAEAKFSALTGKGRIGLLFRDKKVDGFVLNLSAKGMVHKHAIYGDPTEVVVQLLVWLTNIKEAIENLYNMYKERYYNTTEAQKIAHLAHFVKDYKAAKQMVNAGEALVEGEFAERQALYQSKEQGDILIAADKGQQAAQEQNSQVGKEALWYLLGKKIGVEVAFDFIREGGKTEARLNFNKVKALTPGVGEVFRIRTENSKPVIWMELAPGQKFHILEEADPRRSKYTKEMEKWQKPSK